MLIVGAILSGCAVQSQFFDVKSAPTTDQTFVVACNDWALCERRATSLCPSGFTDKNTPVSVAELRELGLLSQAPKPDEDIPEIVRAIECVQLADPN